MKRFLALALILFPPVALADVNISTGSKYSGVRGVAWGASFNVTYILNPVSPEVGVCFYIVNNNPTNAHTFTAQVFQTADSGALDYTNNQGKYGAITITGLPASVGTVSTVAGFAGTTAAATIAFKFTASSALGGSPDTADLFFVQTTSPNCGAAGTGILSVQGAVAETVSLSTVNPVAVGGKTTPNNSFPNANRFVNVLNEGATDLCTVNCYGWMIGAGNLNVLNNFTGLSVPNTGPMAVMLFGQNVSSATSLATFSSFSNPGGTPGIIGAGQSNFSMNSPFFQNNGFATLTASTAISVTQTVSLFGPGWRYGTFDSCYLTLTTGTPTGTTPTMDVTAQTSNDGTNWLDRMHFNQVTTTAATQNQAASIESAGFSFIPTNLPGTLAAGAKLDGPIGGWMRLNIVVTGTTPNFPATQFGVSCH